LPQRNFDDRAFANAVLRRDVVKLFTDVAREVDRNAMGVVGIADPCIKLAGPLRSSISHDVVYGSFGGFFGGPLRRSRGERYTRYAIARAKVEVAHMLPDFEVATKSANLENALHRVTQAGQHQPRVPLYDLSLEHNEAE
jgi:hypothetical protein